MALFMERPGPGGWAHLVSDLPGASGQVELRLLGARLGIRRPVHRSRTYAEHLDIRGREIAMAKEAGVAVIKRRRLALLLRDKRRTERETAQANLLMGEVAPDSPTD